MPKFRGTQSPDNHCHICLHTCHITDWSPVNTSCSEYRYYSCLHSFQFYYYYQYGFYSTYFSDIMNGQWSTLAPRCMYVLHIHHFSYVKQCVSKSCENSNIIVVTETAMFVTHTRACIRTHIHTHTLAVLTPFFR